MSDIIQTLRLFDNENIFFHGRMEVNPVTQEMTSLTFRLDASIPRMESAEDFPKIKIFPNGNFAVDFLGKQVEWAYNAQADILVEIGNHDNEPVKIASWDVCDYVLAYSIANFGSPELQKRNLDFLREVRSI